MKKMYKIALAYLVFGLAVGLFNHEAAYYSGFTGETVMSIVHTHALVLGTAVFMIMPVFMKVFQIDQIRSFARFVVVYNIGLVMTLGFMTVRGATQLFQMNISSFADHMIGGMAGIGHVILTIGVVLLFHAFIKSSEHKSA